MTINGISALNSINNNNFVPTTVQKKGTEKQEKQENVGISYDAANALKAQILYQTPNNKQYLEKNLNKKGIIAALKDKSKIDRSFFGYKNTIAKIITKADNPDLATDNFNILMNAKDKKLNASDITAILLVSTSVNNKKIDEKLMDKYGFNGGTLNDKSIDSILKEINKQRELNKFMMLQQQMLHNQMVQQQMFQTQMLHDQMHQQAMQQHMMMTPGMGF